MVERTDSRQDTAARLLRLLSLLQSRPEWSGAELAERLAVAPRTVRRDVDRLRGLDYMIESTTGTAGGYRLRAGQRLPPLQLEDDEAVAVATGLVTASLSTISHIEDSSTRALVKLERLLPKRLRARLSSIATTATAVPRPVACRVAPSVVATVAWCCAEREIITFGYSDRAGRRSARRVEPDSLVTLEGLWYLVGFDLGRAGWRIFRVDRIDEAISTRHRFLPRSLPAANAAEYLVESLAKAPYRHPVRMRVAMSVDALRGALFRPPPGRVEEAGPEACVLVFSAESVDLAVHYVAVVAALGAPFTVEASDEVRDRLRRLGRALCAG